MPTPVTLSMQPAKAGQISREDDNTPPTVAAAQGSLALVVSFASKANQSLAAKPLRGAPRKDPLRSYNVDVRSAALLRGVRDGENTLVKALLDHREPLSVESLRSAVEMAAKLGKNEMLEALLNCPGLQNRYFHESSLSFMSSALLFATANHQEEAVKILLSSDLKETISFDAILKAIDETEDEPTMRLLLKECFEHYPLRARIESLSRVMLSYIGL